ncbi:MAG TPA: cell envelope integrity protein CreD [Puia sp.]|nr:cell envelope integrity protein CreD [Puia sp.]
MEIKTGNIWNNFRTFFKSGLVGALILLLLIPTAFIQNLVSERQQRQREAVAEIGSRWAGSQTVTGPVIGIPYYDSLSDNGTRQRVKRWAYFLPDKLAIHSRIVPEKRYRGIYEVIVYTTEMNISAGYQTIPIGELGLSPADMLWKEATVFLDISDIQGLNEDVVMKVVTPGAVADVPMVSGLKTTEQWSNALSAGLPDSLARTALEKSDAGRPALEFGTTVRIKGSDNLLFVPVGKETKVSATSSWSSPSFTGSTLPDVRSIKDSGFAADWKVIGLHRKFPQQWKQSSYELAPSAFGVNLIVPVDAYQQTTRSVKYAILVILLTFTAFLLIEWIYNLPIHALQYVLVGFALCIFYTLLLSLSEYLGFNTAYGLAAVATIGLIGWYVRSILQSGKIAAFITFLLVVQYGFIFILIQLQDYALLMGSIGLFVTLAVVMQASKKIKWQTA